MVTIKIIRAIPFFSGVYQTLAIIKCEPNGITIDLECKQITLCCGKIC